MQVLYRLSYVGPVTLPGLARSNRGAVAGRDAAPASAAAATRTRSLTKLLERETGFEPATLSLEG